VKLDGMASNNMEYSQATSLLKELWDTYGKSIDTEYELFSKS
jgi:hypothetical protein